jgi:hypothetical protein
MTGNRWVLQGPAKAPVGWPSPGYPPGAAPDLAPSRSTGASARAHSGRANRQDWPEYCVLILAWFPPRLIAPAPDLAASRTSRGRSGAFLYFILIPPAASARAQPPQKPAKRAALPGVVATADAQQSYPSLAPWLVATSAPS